MTIVFIRPANIFVTPAYKRVVDSCNLSERKDTKLVVVHWDSAFDNTEKGDVEFRTFRGAKNGIGYIKWLLFIYKSLRRTKPTYIHNFSFQNWFPIYFYSVFFKLKGIFYDCRDYFGWSKNRNAVLTKLIIGWDRFMAKKCQTIIFPDETGFSYFKTEEKKYFVVPNTVEDYFDEIELHRSDSGEKIKLVYTGYLSNDRNIQAIIDGVKRSDNIELHIASNYISGNFDHLLLEDSRFVYHGSLSHREVIDLFLACDYCLIMYNADLQNYQKIQPTKFYDAIMSNTPYISSIGMTSLECYIGKDWPNICLPYNDPNAFEGLVKPNITNKNRELYLDKYQYMKVLNNLGDIYTSFLSDS